ncbi:MAG: 3-dehydroquinate synthase family protein, partial [Bacteroidales bacterium]
MKTNFNPAVYKGVENLGDFKQFIANSKYSAIIVIVDENTQKYCLPLINDYLGNFTLISVSSGENNKTINTCVDVWNQMADKAIDRKALIINLGGGVICDMGGFIAATYKRGIDFVHIPTTLLAMCDASIGGKLGVNFSGYKNTIGLFKNPIAIVFYTGFLKTLPEKQFLSGFAEVIKHALIDDKRFFNELTNLTNLKEEAENLVARSIKIKTKITNLD